MQRGEPQVKGLEAQHRKPLEVAQATMAEAHTLAAKQRWVGVVGMCAGVCCVAILLQRQRVAVLLQRWRIIVLLHAVWYVFVS